jgi:uncharacterized protein with HEPN domain
MSPKDPLIYLAHIRDCCQRIIEYTNAAGESWASTPLILDAVCRNLTIIGEAARNLDKSFHDAHPEVPWSSLIGARNVVMHAYASLRPELIQEMAERDVPALLAECIRMLADS